MNKIINLKSLKISYSIKGLILLFLPLIIGMVAPGLALGTFIIFYGLAFICFFIAATKKEKQFFIFVLPIVCIYFFLFYFFSQYFMWGRMHGNGMEPYIKNGDILIFKRFNFKKFNESIKRGDIVMVLAAPQEFRITMVIGLPGEEVSLKNGTIFINGEPLRNIHYNLDKLSGDRDGFVVVPKNCFFGIQTNPQKLITSSDKTIFLPRWIYRKLDIFGKLFLRF